MSTALEYLYEILFGFLDLVFDRCQIVNGVYLGWVLVAISLTSVMIRSIIALPKTGGRVKLPKEE